MAIALISWLGIGDWGWSFLVPLSHLWAISVWALGKEGSKDGHEELFVLWEDLSSGFKGRESSEGLLSCMPETEEEGEQQVLQPKESRLLAGSLRVSETVEAYSSRLSEAVEAEEKGTEEAHLL
ncbi:MAG: hypothetical protein ACQXXG_09925 [Candidatus Bathyarchaeia archaeon]